MLTVDIREDEALVATIVARGPEPANPSVYGQAWICYDVQYRERTGVAWRGDVHVRRDETFLAQLGRIASKVKKENLGGTED